MKLKKISRVIVSCLLAGSLFAGCGGGGGDTQKPAATSGGDTKIGMIKQLNVSEQKIADVLKEAGARAGLNLGIHETTFYDNLNSMLMGIESGSVQEISTYNCVANYLIGKDSKFEIVTAHSMKLKDSFCFALRTNEEALKNDLNNALDSMKTDGTLDKLAKEYIADLKPGEDPPAVEIAKIDGADTLKIAVTGDLPPLDLILADGKPAGFNTAMLAELGKRLNKNIELVQVDGAARGSALTSNKVDVVFWAILPIGEGRPTDTDMPSGVEFSTPYFTDEIVHIEQKK